MTPLADLDVPATNYAGYRSVSGTARLNGQTALQAIDRLLAGTYEPKPAT